MLDGYHPPTMSSRSINGRTHEITKHRMLYKLDNAEVHWDFNIIDLLLIIMSILSFCTVLWTDFGPSPLPGTRLWISVGGDDKQESCGT
jgi:hypothetical protein